MKRTTTKLADGRELIYFDLDESTERDTLDRRVLEPVDSQPELRLDLATGDWVTIASHRQGRVHHPPTDACPLCPSADGHRSEVPAADYEVAVFENRFPSLAGRLGRCEVVCFTPEHGASFADLTEDRARLVLDAWTDRTERLSALPGIEQVYCFENRGAEIGVTLAHPHGQVYAFSFVPPRTAKMLAVAATHRSATGGNLFEDLLAEARATTSRVVLAGEHWTAFVPYAARWPYEVHLYPHRRVPDLTHLTEAERAEFPGMYLELLRRFDRLFPQEGGTVQTAPTPYISAWHQAPKTGGQELALHLELFTVRRSAGKLKFLAGVESGMDSFVNDVAPEVAAARLREVAS
ncbi:MULTISPECIES: galactose-1-phosphate uridylyltransferase [Streptomyces]|uniref:galactose-1-phosphate uridylyltransferase n=1 Tax=Streptomyces TaxID=1883 RepID=UPI00017E8EE1|nr:MULTISPECIES: galactose-1-phosphate uridylyltransferase [Streptomyces]AKL70736.1 galactose-1-phosphate uridylyltransferase [Streptomyces sp. Mg1]EDX24247.1 galactose-1-phosphate uridylyltransferase [Streptomyces sp. Mg1]WSS03692.1 galactose-1-phosphate uridylyltransferase [Streptomyces goshikiensis]WSY02803.1 galactose-1-phosphate uridylyltransferase [Streptomyces goshikiensis]